MGLLQRFDELLYEAGHSFEALAVGRSGLCLLEARHVMPPLELLYALPRYVVEIADCLAETKAAEHGWLRQHAAQFGEQITALPDGWRERMQLVAFGGRALHLHCPGRIDLIALELLGAHRVGDPEPNLGHFQPAEGEIAAVARWAESQVEAEPLKALLRKHHSLQG